MATGWDGLGFESRKKSDFLVFKTLRPGLGSSRPPMQWVPGLVPEGKESGE